MLAVKKDSPVRSFVILSYALFVALLLATGGLIGLGAPSWLVTTAKNVCAWAPTFALLILFRRLYAGSSFQEFLAACLLTGRRPWLFACSALLQIALFAAALALLGLWSGKGLSATAWTAPAALLPGLVITLTSGPAGEELGWRGFLLPAFLRTRSPLSAGLRVGLLWGFWHLPLWLLSGYGGLELLAYVVAFLVALVAMSVIITFFQQATGTVLASMWLHFCFNFAVQFVDFQPILIPLMASLALVYALCALVLVVLFRKSMLAVPAPGPGEIAPGQNERPNATLA